MLMNRADNRWSSLARTLGVATAAIAASELQRALLLDDVTQAGMTVLRDKGVLPPVDGPLGDVVDAIRGLPR